LNLLGVGIVDDAEFTFGQHRIDPRDVFAYGAEPAMRLELTGSRLKAKL
jgi:hypothetical protein